MQSYFNRLSKPEVEFLLDNCNLSEEDEEIFILASAGHSNTYIANETSISMSNVVKKKRKIRKKINDFLEVADNMAIVYVNGKRVSKDELKKYEIQIDTVKKLILKKLTEN